MKTCSPKLMVTNWYCKLVGLSKSVELLRDPRVAGPPSQAFPAPTWSWVKPLKNHAWKTSVGKVTFQGLCLYVKLWGGYIVETSRDWMIFGISTAKKKKMTRESLISLHLMAPQLTIICLRFFWRPGKTETKEHEHLPNDLYHVFLLVQVPSAP